MPNEIFLIDSDTLITPYKSFYPFDMVPDFWDFLESKIVSKNILILDMVYNEIIPSVDQLSNWLSDVKNLELIDRRDGTIINNYRNILTFIQNSRLYKKPEALNNWSSPTVADPWLIATALARSYTVITLEKPNASLNEKQPTKNVKIPDICKQFNVKCNDLYYMMRQLGFKRPMIK